MTLLFIKNGYYAPIKIINPLLRREYPQNGMILALVDTGFDGFIVIPENIFSELGLNQIVSDKPIIRGICCEIQAMLAPVRLVFGEIGITIDGDCLTYNGSNEVIIGLEALSEIEIKINGCRKSGELARCL